VAVWYTYCVKKNLATLVTVIGSEWILRNRPRLKTYVGMCEAGLPDVLFSNKKSQYGKILEGLAMENLGIGIL
jgi:hypothetical protein